MRRGEPFFFVFRFLLLLLCVYRKCFKILVLGTFISYFGQELE